MPWAARSVVPIDSSISKVIIMTALRQQMENDMVLRGMAVRTRQSYIEAVRGLAKFYRRSPDRIAVQEVQSYLLHLLQERGLSYSTCNLVANGLRFFYRITLGQSETEFCLPRPKVPQRLPEILSREEIERLFAVTTNVKHRVLLMATYSAGLRVSQVARLKVSDIDSQRMTLRVDQGKGAKDRYTLLSKRLRSCAGTGRPTGPASGSFPYAMGGAPSIHARPRRSITTPRKRPGSGSAAGSMAFGMPSPRTCWRESISIASSVS
jgi:integrase